MQASDLPAGWTSTPSKPDPKEAAEQAALVKCVGGKDTAAEQTGDIDSPDFGFNGAQVSSSASTYKDQAAVVADVALIHNPKISTCYQQLLKAELPASLPAGSTLTSVTFNVAPAAAGAPANVAGIGSGDVVLTTAGKPLTIYLAVAFITGPLVEANVTVENPTQPVPAAFFNTLTKAVATRAAKG